MEDVQNSDMKRLKYSCEYTVKEHFTPSLLSLHGWISTASLSFGFVLGIPHETKWNLCQPRLAIRLPLVFIVLLLVHFSVSLPPRAVAHVFTWCAARQAGCGASSGNGCHVNGQTHGHGIGQ